MLASLTYCDTFVICDLKEQNAESRKIKSNAKQLPRGNENKPKNFGRKSNVPIALSQSFVVDHGLRVEGGTSMESFV
jgi:hypothetical protein